MQNFSAEPEESAHVLDDAAKDFRSGINGVTFAAVAEPAKALADALDDLSAAAAAATSKASDDSWMGDSDLLAARDRINNAASQLQDLCEKE
ncbi:hypothetical protein SAMN05216554_1089 [Herbiconiux ginsengi]|uniref:Uncharacterized protein n=2 Tax=Herbiconiux ginsengi TaxID=381665 RepID=A0A1H3LR00_9MICO|nr:hypothetical protein SAMN05216554_1089 [Herbiconiux ginsengi]